MGLLRDHFRTGIIIKASVLCLENLGVMLHFTSPFHTIPGLPPSSLPSLSPCIQTLTIAFLNNKLNYVIS